MRQAGRSLPRYRESRAEQGMFEIFRDPALAAEITAMPLEYYPVDACVLYNDLSTPFFAAGLEVEMRPGVGPVVDRPIRSNADLDRLLPHDPREARPYVMEQVRIPKNSTPAPGLAVLAVPFTLSSSHITAHRRAG